MTFYFRSDQLKDNRLGEIYKWETDIVKQYIYIYIFLRLAMGGVVEGENVVEEGSSSGTPLAKGTRPR